MVLSSSKKATTAPVFYKDLSMLLLIEKSDASLSRAEAENVTVRKLTVTNNAGTAAP